MLRRSTFALYSGGAPKKVADPCHLLNGRTLALSVTRGHEKL